MEYMEYRTHMSNPHDPHDPPPYYTEPDDPFEPQPLPANWNTVNQYSSRASTFSDPSKIYNNAKEPIITRRRHNGAICAICGYRLGDFANLAKVNRILLNQFLHRHRAVNAIAIQQMADTINYIKGANVVTIDWCLKYLRHDISDIPKAERDGTFQWQTHAYSRLISDRAKIGHVQAIANVIRKHVPNQRHVELGVVPATVLQSIKSHEQIMHEIAEEKRKADLEASIAHNQKILTNQVRINANLLRRPVPKPEEEEE